MKVALSNTIWMPTLQFIYCFARQNFEENTNYSYLSICWNESSRTRISWIRQFASCIRRL